MKKNLLFLELNECDFSYFLYGAKKYNFTRIKNFFKKKKIIKTYTLDKKEGLNLDPWVQWVSVHTGLSSDIHKTYRIGQDLNLKIDQLWDVLARKEISTSVWGAFNANLRSKKKIDLFFPDPWSYNQKTYPRKFDDYLKLPRYYAQSYPSPDKFKLIKYSFLFFKKLFFSSNFSYLFKNSFIISYFFIKSNFKSFNLYFFLDLASLLILKKNLNYKKSDFVILAMNCFAHYQHNFWDNKKYEYIYFWYLNEMIKILNTITPSYNSTITCNGFSQKKIKAIFHLRPKKINNFFKTLGINYISIKANMTAGVTIFFKDTKNKTFAINRLKDIAIFDYPLFEIQDYKNKNVIFCKFQLVLKKKIISFDNINKSNYSSYFQEPSNKITGSKFLDKIFLNNLFKQLIFIRSTSVHKSDGLLFYDGFFSLSKTKKKIPNHIIFNHIINYFS